MTSDSLQKLADSMNRAALANTSDPAACNAYRDCAGRVQRLIQQAPPRRAKAVAPPPPPPETLSRTIPFVPPEPSDR
jgi:hypothetical protein